MIYQAILKISGREIPILYYNYQCHILHCDDPNLGKIIQLHIQVCREIGNREDLPVEGDLIMLTFECTGDELFFYDWLNGGSMRNGEIHFVYNEVETVDVFRFWDCYCVGIRESMTAGSVPMAMTVFLSPGIIKRNGLEAREKVWKESEPSTQHSAENVSKTEAKKNAGSQENANFTRNSSKMISEAEQAVVNAQVKQMEQILKTEEERFNRLLQSDNDGEPSNKQKGNYGEIKSCLNLLSNEKLKKGVNGKQYNLKRIGDDAPNSLDSKIRQGIDGIYENLTPVPDFVIDETKYGTSTLSETKGSGPQMSMKWIINRVSKLHRRGVLSEEQYEKFDLAIKNNTIESIVSHVYPNSEIIVAKKISLKSECTEAETTNDFIFSDWP